MKRPSVTLLVMILLLLIGLISALSKQEAFIFLFISTDILFIIPIVAFAFIFKINRYYLLKTIFLFLILLLMLNSITPSNEIINIFRIFDFIILTFIIYLLRTSTRLVKITGVFLLIGFILAISIITIVWAKFLIFGKDYSSSISKAESSHFEIGFKNLNILGEFCAPAYISGAYAINDLDKEFDLVEAIRRDQLNFRHQDLDFLGMAVNKRDYENRKMFLIKKYDELRKLGIMKNY